MAPNKSDGDSIETQFKVFRARTEMWIKILLGLVAFSNGDVALSVIKGVLL